MHPYDAHLLIGGIVHTSSPRKQKLGQQLAEHFSFVPGPGGSDGSVDGAIMSGTVLAATFQSKLSSSLIPLAEGKILHSDLIRLKPKLCIYVSGIGFDGSFERLLLSQEVSSQTEVYLLKLYDIVTGSDAYLKARDSLPQHTGGKIDWSQFLV